VAVPGLALGIPDRFIEHGSRDENLADAGLDLESLRGAITRFWSRGAAPRAVPAGG
jgi:1-deoxy-D-xylulose-5-phosphate synthase